MTILAIDPGKTTGLCHWASGTMSAWQDSYDEALTTAMHYILNDQIDDFVIEDFIISERTTRMGTANWRRGMELEFIGATRWACQQSGVRFHLQTPQQAKSFSTDAKLKHLDWWTVGSDHPRDATRHALLWLVRHGQISAEDLIDNT